MKPAILFIGGTPRGLKLITKLIQRRERIVYAAIMKEDEHEPLKVSGEIARICQKHGVNHSIRRKIDPSFAQELLKGQPEVALVCGWRTLLPKDLYSQIPHGCLAAHDSLLPRYRGFAPTAWAIINGERKTGVTLFKIGDGEADSGDIWGQKAVPIGKDETATEIYPRIIKASVELYEGFLDALSKGTVKFRRQDEKKATYAARRRPEDGEVNWQQPARKIFNFHRALTPPYPYAWTRQRGEKIYIVKAEIAKKQLKYPGNRPGQILAVSGRGVHVQCAKGQIILKSLKNDDGPILPAGRYLSSANIQLGS